MSCRLPGGVDAEHLGARPLAWTLEKRSSSPTTRRESHIHDHLHPVAPLSPFNSRTRHEGPAEEPTRGAVRHFGGDSPACGRGRPVLIGSVLSERSGDSPLYLRNVRYLAGHRGPAWSRSPCPVRFSRWCGFPRRVRVGQERNYEAGRRRLRKSSFTMARGKAARSLLQLESKYGGWKGTWHPLNSSSELTKVRQRQHSSTIHRIRQASSANEAVADGYRRG